MSGLQNGGFEQDWGSHDVLVCRPGQAPTMETRDNIFTPRSWVTWFYHDPDTWDQPEVHDAWKSGDPRRVHSGEKAVLLFTFYRKHDAGFRQRVQVEEGAKLCLEAYAHAWSNWHDGEHPDDPRWSDGPGYNAGFALEGTAGLDDNWRNFTFYLGIDPTGGVNPYADTVVWGEGAHIYNEHAPVPSVTVTARSATITIFLRSKTLWTFKHNDAYWDDATLTQVGDEPPAYASTMLVLPQNATPEQLDEILRIAYPKRQTIGHSHDDAGVLGGKAVLYNIPLAKKQEYLDWYAEYYPIAEVEFAYTSDWDIPVPPPPPDLPLIGLHLQAMQSGALDYVRAVKPRVMKIFQAENAQAIKAASPETLVVLRYFTPDQPLDGDLAKSAWDYVASFADTMREHAQWIDYVESWNETIPSCNATAIRRAIEFDCHFADALAARGFGVAPVLLNVAVGNPYHKDGEIELLLPAVAKAVQYGGALGYHCFSSDTDILTQQGWLPLSELVEGQWAIPVATLNTETDEVEYQLPTEYFAHDYKGKMFHTMGKVDIMVTPNHRVWARRGRIRGKGERTQWSPESPRPFEFIQAQDLPLEFCLRRDLAEYEGLEREWFILPEYFNTWKCGKEGRISRQYHRAPRHIPMDTWLRLFGYWLTEGSLGGSDNALISQTPGDICDDIKKVITEAGWKPAWYKSPNKSAGDFCFGGVQLASYLRKFGKARDKYIPRHLLELPQRQLRILFDAMMAGDGHINAEGVECSYGTLSQQMADDFQELALKLGYTTTLSQHISNGIFCVTLGTKIKEPRTRLDKYTEWIDYDGPVYCITVPNGIIFTRRNGKPSWQGNSYWLHNDQVQGPEQDWKYYAGRWEQWDKVFAAHGYKPRYIFGECGAFASCNDGWRAGMCCGGDWDKYQSQILEFQRRLVEWNATHDDRALGGTIFTTCPHWMNWESFRITEPEMIKLAQALTV